MGPDLSDWLWVRCVAAVARPSDSISERRGRRPPALSPGPACGRPGLPPGSLLSLQRQSWLETPRGVCSWALSSRCWLSPANLGASRETTHRAEATSIQPFVFCHVKLSQRLDLLAISLTQPLQGLKEEVPGLAGGGGEQAPPPAEPEEEDALSPVVSPLLQLLALLRLLHLYSPGLQAQMRMRADPRQARALRPRASCITATPAAGGEAFSFRYSPGKLRGNQYKKMMSKEELEEEQRVQKQQLAAIFKLMQDNKETFGELSDSDVQEQLRLYDM
ncbi:Matrix-remodeling-associated protein 7 [Galemys pyrenaicus]|uniref:Matrix-remodeling-associated protein 7 n=1 Tax=Galemys pyrenaicus TaxID=202257 RepID=A0A8J6ALB2_GALPY|nr:Matrix-remodeling-associated protein 7 [Galemys pyrenaicus]